MHMGRPEAQAPVNWKPGQAGWAARACLHAQIIHMLARWREHCGERVRDALMLRSAAQASTSSTRTSRRAT